VNNVKIKKIKKNEILFKEGDKAINIYLVKKGTFFLSKFKGDRLIPLGFRKNKDVIVLNEILNKKVYEANCICTSDAEIIVVSVKDIKDFFKTTPEWMSILLNTIIKKELHTINVISENAIVIDELFDNNNFSMEEEKKYKKIIK
jgi:CRP-like cAMP-binding protein